MQVIYEFFSKDSVEYVTCCEGLSDKYLKWSTLAIEGEPKASSGNWFSTKSIKTTSTMGFCNLSDDGKLIYLNHGDISLTLYQYELFNDEPIKTSNIGFVAPVSGHLSDCSYVSEGKLVSLTADQLQMQDISTGKVLDTIPIQMGAISALWPVAGTHTFLTVDTISKTVRKYKVSDDKLVVVQEWSVLGLHMMPFHRGDETFIANLLPDGITIEVRNLTDGSVVSSSTCPSSVSRLPMTTTGFLVWKPLGIWTDVFTGKRLAIPRSFEPFFGYTNGNRMVAIRHERGAMLFCVMFSSVI